jgi:hypothetical protein
MVKECNKKIPKTNQHLLGVIHHISYPIELGPLVKSEQLSKRKKKVLIIIAKASP